MKDCFCVERFLFYLGLYVTDFVFVAVVNREFIWELIICLSNSFFVTFW